MENAGAERRRRAVGAAAAVAAIVAADQAAKTWAVGALADGPISIVGDTVEFTLHRNPGSAFSAIRGGTPVLALTAVAIAWFLARAVARTTDRWMLAGLVLVLGGALGNLTDRLARDPGFLRGHVVDFVRVGWWPVFNVADSAITVGAVVLVLRTWRAHDAGVPGAGTPGERGARA